LLTPLVFSTSGKVVLVDRGWIPENDLQRASWAKYDQPGNVTITGRLMVPVVTNWRLAKPTNSQTDFVPSVNLDFIGYQAGYPLLPVYLIATAQPEGSGPQASLPPLDLSEGPHLSYAIQWFTFAAGLGIGYPIYLILRKRKMQPQQ
jgi:surfeit locus 1 family protein